MRISDWSSDCALPILICPAVAMGLAACSPSPYYTGSKSLAPGAVPRDGLGRPVIDGEALVYDLPPPAPRIRSEEHTSELQSLMRISYAVFCLKKKKKQVKTQE